MVGDRGGSFRGSPVGIPRGMVSPMASHTPVSNESGTHNRGTRHLPASTYGANESATSHPEAPVTRTHALDPGRTTYGGTT